MKKLGFTFIMIAFIFKTYGAQILHHTLSNIDKENATYIWEESSLPPFDELIVSWDAKRPQKGAFLIQLSVLNREEWSPWLDYALWSSIDQCTYKHQLPDSNVQVDQDALQILNGSKALGFKVRVLAKANGNLKEFHTLHASMIEQKKHCVDLYTPVDSSQYVNLALPAISQMALQGLRKNRLCSPTSLTSVLRYLSKKNDVNPLDIAKKVYDSSFDIYGNWILNTAQASDQLGDLWQCYAAHFTHFNQILNQLIKGYPVIVSVRGPLKGSAFPYESGHLLVVEGFDPATQNVLCMDPAFPSDSETAAKYSLSEFLTAWNRRQGIAYIFDQK